LKRLQEVHLNTLTRIERYRKTGQGGTFTDLSSTFEDGLCGVRAKPIAHPEAHQQHDEK
jgi:hypothetical protein